MALASIFKKVPAGAFAFQETISSFHGMWALISGESSTVAPDSFCVRVNFEKTSSPTKRLKSLLAEGTTLLQPDKIPVASSNPMVNFLNMTRPCLRQTRCKVHHPIWAGHAGL